MKATAHFHSPISAPPSDDAALPRPRATPITTAEPPVDVGNQDIALHLLLRVAPVGIAVVVGRVIQWTNDRFAGMLGYARDELRGQRSRVLYDTDKEMDRVRHDLLAQLQRKGAGETQTVWRRKDGTLADVWMSCAAIDPAAIDKGGIITALDISDLKRSQREREAFLLRTRSQQTAIVRLATHPQLTSPDLDEALRTVTEIAADAVSADRIGVWLLGPDDSALACADLYDRRLRTHSKAGVLPILDYPRYAEALRLERAVDARDVSSDPRTADMAEGFLAPRGISALLSASIRTAGRVVGAIWIEHLGTPRKWHADEVKFAGETADQVAQVLLNHEHRRTETSRIESDEKYRALFGGVRDAVFVLSIGADGALGPFVEVNDIACQTLGYGRDELLQMSIADIDAPESAADIRRFVHDVLNGKDVVFEQVHVARDGRRVPVEIHAHRFLYKGHPAIMSTARDISERKRSENELRKFKTITDQASYGASIADNRGVLMYVNPVYASMHGYTQEDLVGRHWSILHPENRTDHADLLTQTLLAEGGLTAQKVWHRKANGDVFPLLMNASVIRDVNGIPLYLATTAADITHQESLESQLKQSQKMEVVGQLAGGVAHDFNNMLMAIHGYVELAMQRDEVRTACGPELLEIQSAAMRAAELTRQLLAFGRRQILKPLNLDLNKKVTELLKMVRRVIGEQNGVHFVPGADIGIVRADPVQMDQVIMNLCINSRDAMPDGGTIRIETSDVFIEAGSPHAPALVSPGRYVRLTISDTGSGMTADVMKHLFEPFFTTKEVGKGTGMGLATVYGIIRQHDGYIDCRSAPGKGTTFEILMPTIEQEATATETRVEKPSPRGTETVLVAEDDEAVRRMATRVLESAGYAVITAVDGAEALRKLDAAGDRIAMALLDVVMPNGGGRRVHEVIRLRHPHVRVLFTSGYAADSIHRGFVLEEGLNLIQKPYGAGELLRAVRKVIDASAVN